VGGKVRFSVFALLWVPWGSLGLAISSFPNCLVELRGSELISWVLSQFISGEIFWSMKQLFCLYGPTLFRIPDSCFALLLCSLPEFYSLSSLRLIKCRRSMCCFHSLKFFTIIPKYSA
jgi:hypothetical protein